MIRSIKNSLLKKTVFLFAVVVFTPVCLMAYFVYNIFLDNHEENILSGLNSGADYINTIFETKVGLVSGNSIKLKDDFGFIALTGSVLKGIKDPSVLIKYLSSNYGYRFFMIRSISGKEEIFCSHVIKRNDILDKIDLIGEPVIQCASDKFIVAIKFVISIEGTDHYMITGDIIGHYKIYEFSNILDFDFTLLKKNDHGAKNVFTTIHDDYGYILDKGDFTVDQRQLNNVVTVSVGEKKRKLLTFDLKYFENDHIGAVTKSEDFRYLDSARNHFMLLIIFFIVLAVILAILIKLRIINPVIQLLEGIKTASFQIQQGQPIESLKIKNQDEIGALAFEYNKMASDLAKSFSRIKFLQNYLLNIFESMPSGLIVVDNSGKITQWNKNMENYAGNVSSLKKGSEIWRSLPELNIQKDDLIRMISEKKQLEIYREQSDNGSKKNLNIHLFPLISNGISGSVIRIDDVTELKRKEEQLLQSQKMETVGTLAGGIAHDFNNILAGIVGVVSLLRHKMEQGMEISDDLLKDYLEIMEQSGNRAADIVQRLLTLSKKQSVSVKQVMASEVINHVIKICSNTFDKSINIKSINLESGILVMIDFTQLEQVILNMAINAAHAMTIMRQDDSEWGGELTIEIVEKVPKEELSFFMNNAESKPDYFKIIIRDTGIGMDTETVKQIYEPFFSKKDKTKGTGLGLTIVYNIVQHSGGFIDIDSQPGKGSEFRIYFPASVTGISRPDAQTESRKVVEGSGTILVIDDEIVLRELAVSMLVQAGYSVLTASDGKEGIEIYKKDVEKIDLVLLDMMMPNKNGKETFVELLFLNKDIKVVMTSGFTKDKRVEEVLELGAKDFIQKPYTIFSLSKKIYKVLNEK
ncbi:MAG: response regulator [Candidatus Delongbacteria bacterium]